MEASNEIRKIAMPVLYYVKQRH